MSDGRPPRTAPAKSCGVRRILTVESCAVVAELNLSYRHAVRTETNILLDGFPAANGLWQGQYQFGDFWTMSLMQCLALT